jgi:hypothetical protein
MSATAKFVEGAPPRLAGAISTADYAGAFSHIVVLTNPLSSSGRNLAPLSDHLAEGLKNSLHGDTARPVLVKVYLQVL